MALTVAELQALVKAQNLQYFVHPERPALMLNVSAMFGGYHFVIALELEGTFLQFRTLEYLHCPNDHRHLPAVLRVLAEINYRARLVKLGWDPSDGEIVAYADVWLQDGTLTKEQFGRIVQNFVPVIDLSYGRLKQTLETGKDPGERDPLDLLAEAAGGSGGLPAKLAELVKKLRGEAEQEKKKAGDKGKKADDTREPDFSTI